MEIYFQLINDAESLKKACEELKGAEYLGFDVETTDLDPYRGELRLVQLSDGRNTKVVDVRAFAGGDRGSGGENHPVPAAGTPHLRKEGSSAHAGVSFLRTNPDLAPLRD